MKDFMNAELHVGDIVIIAEAKPSDYHKLAPLRFARIVSIYDTTDTVETIFIGTTDSNRFINNPAHIMLYTSDYQSMHPNLVDELFTKQVLAS